jgi:hypothetical protein
MQKGQVLEKRLKSLVIFFFSYIIILGKFQRAKKHLWILSFKHVIVGEVTTLHQLIMEKTRRKRPGRRYWENSP